MLFKIKVANQPTSQARGEGANQQSDDAREANAEFAEGTFVGVYLDKYKDERFPIIGQITKMCENGQDVELDWYVGCYSGPWKVCKVRGKVWSEVILLTAVLCSVTVTKNMKLTASSVDALKAAYTKFE